MARLIDVALTHPAAAIAAELSGTAVALLVLYCLIGAAWEAIDRWRHRIPAAPDNQPGSDTTDLWTCRRINALPTASRKESQP